MNRLCEIALLTCILASCVLAQNRRGFEVTSTSGESITVREAILTYYLATPEEQGIKIRQGGGETVVSWKRIKRIDIPKPSDSQDIKAEITQPDDKKVSVTLVPAMLKGKTELGDYSVSVGDLLSIQPLPVTKK